MSTSLVSSEVKRNISKIAFHTLGCKLNFSESSYISKSLQENDYNIVNFNEFADAYIINTCSGVLDSVVIGVEDQKWGMVSAAVFESLNGKVSIKEVSNFCKKNMPSYMMPKYFISINKIPYKNNKIDYDLIQHYVSESVL